MNVRKAGLMALVGSMCMLLVFGISTVYDDHKQQKQHEIAINDLVTLVNTVKGGDVGTRVIDLPEDGNRWYLTIFKNSDTPSVEQWFDTDARLAHLKQQCQYMTYKSSDKMYQSRWRPFVTDEFPCVVLQQADGNVVYKASGVRMPRTPQLMAEQIAKSVRDCPNCHPVHPTPSPTPPAPPQPYTPSPVPDVGPVQPVQPADDGMPMAFALVAGLVGAGIAGLIKFNKNTGLGL